MKLPADRKPPSRRDEGIIGRGLQPLWTGATSFFRSRPIGTRGNCGSVCACWRFPSGPTGRKRHFRQHTGTEVPPYYPRFPMGRDGQVELSFTRRFPSLHVLRPSSNIAVRISQGTGRQRHHGNTTRPIDDQVARGVARRAGAACLSNGGGRNNGSCVLSRC